MYEKRFKWLKLGDKKVQLKWDRVKEKKREREEMRGREIYKER